MPRDNLPQFARQLRIVTMSTMFTPLHTPQEAAAKNLRRLLWLRIVMVALIGIASWAAVGFYGIPLPMFAVIGAMLLMLALNAVTWWRLNRPIPIRDIEILTQLLLDMAILTGLFYATGGYTNPFVWMYLLPLTVAAVSLPWRHTWLIALVDVACYSGLMFWYQPLPMLQMEMSGSDHLHMLHMQHESGFGVHLLGMWAGFVVSAGVIAFFVERMGRTLREYDRMLASARESMLESERMLALGSLAAGAAHELGTPLATMAVLTKEMSQEYASDDKLVGNLALLRKQVERCKQILSSLAASTGQARAEDSQGTALDVFLGQTLERWRDAHPAIKLESSMHGPLPAPVIVTDRTLSQALVNLFDNAAEAAASRVSLQGDWNADELTLDIHDDGPGLAPDVEPHLGTPFFTTKQEKGMGLGLYLARTILERFGGTVSLENHPQGGALTHIRLPLAELTLKEQA